MSDTTYVPAIGDRVRFLGGGDRTTGGAWTMLKIGATGTIEARVNEDEDKDKLFVIFDDVEMPFASFARQLGQPTGWPILASEVEQVI